MKKCVQPKTRENLKTAISMLSKPNSISAAKDFITKASRVTSTLDTRTNKSLVEIIYEHYLTYQKTNLPIAQEYMSLLLHVVSGKISAIVMGGVLKSALSKNDTTTIQKFFEQSAHNFQENFIIENECSHVLNEIITRGIITKEQMAQTRATIEPLKLFESCKTSDEIFYWLKFKNLDKMELQSHKFYDIFIKYINSPDLQSAAPFFFKKFISKFEFSNFLSFIPHFKNKSECILWLLNNFNLFNMSQADSSHMHTLLHCMTIDHSTCSISSSQLNSILLYASQFPKCFEIYRPIIIHAYKAKISVFIANHVFFDMAEKEKDYEMWMAILYQNVKLDKFSIAGNFPFLQSILKEKQNVQAINVMCNGNWTLECCNLVLFGSTTPAVATQIDSTHYLWEILLPRKIVPVELQSIISSYCNDVEFIRTFITTQPSIKPQALLRGALSSQHKQVLEYIVNFFISQKLVATLKDKQLYKYSCNYENLVYVLYHPQLEKNIPVADVCKFLPEISDLRIIQFFVTDYKLRRELISKKEAAVELVNSIIRFENESLLLHFAHLVHSFFGHGNNAEAEATFVQELFQAVPPKNMWKLIHESRLLFFSRFLDFFNLFDLQNCIVIDYGNHWNPSISRIKMMIDRGALFSRGCSKHEKILFLPNKDKNITAALLNAVVESQCVKMLPFISAIPLEGKSIIEYHNVCISKSGEFVVKGQTLWLASVYNLKRIVKNMYKKPFTGALLVTVYDSKGVEITEKLPSDKFDRIKVTVNTTLYHTGNFNRITRNFQDVSIKCTCT